ncbi:MAG: Nif3-like dinuclear metal center hexameric protein [Nitrospirota bacterium]|jgi:dinuclear metal center YbgI/SA1388 family protein
MASLSEIVNYTDRFLRIHDVGDWDNALNGLQIENSGRVTRIGAAVDISTRVLSEAVNRNIDFLIVHHGLFWPGLQPIKAALRRQLRLAFENDIALYSTHLPLDVHPRVGNNALLVTALFGVKSLQQNCTASVSDANSIARRFTETPYKTKSIQPFLEEKGQPVGLKIRASLQRSELVRKLQRALKCTVKVFDFGPKETRTIGVVTGAAGSEIYRVADEGIDTFITGEAPHWAAVAAEELGMNLLLGGHYATEVFGVKALAAHLSKRFRVPWEFIGCPTGL